LPALLQPSTHTFALSPSTHAEATYRRTGNRTPQTIGEHCRWHRQRDGRDRSGKDITEQGLSGGAAEVGAGLAGPQIIDSFPVPKGLKFGTTSFGDYAHSAIGDLLQELYPEAKFILRVRRAQTDVGVQVEQESINTVGFCYGEIKPLSASGKSRFNRQVLDWTCPNQSSQ
jgi:hypothetical protein